MFYHLDIVSVLDSVFVNLINPFYFSYYLENLKLLTGVTVCIAETDTEFENDLPKHRPLPCLDVREWCRQHPSVSSIFLYVYACRV